MIDLELAEGEPLTDEEMLLEAKAWGFETVEEMLKNIEEALTHEKNAVTRRD